MNILKTKLIDDIPEVLPEDLKNHLADVELIDVRRADEFNGELGHIKGAKLVTLGDSLISFLESADREKEIVFICRSGGRSGQATKIGQSLGFEKCVNMTGGMIRWNELKLPVDKN